MDAETMIRRLDLQPHPQGGAWTLVSCTVSPAFDFADFELAPEGWRPA